MTISETVLAEYRQQPSDKLEAMIESARQEIDNGPPSTIDITAEEWTGNLRCAIEHAQHVLEERSTRTHLH